MHSQGCRFMNTTQQSWEWSHIPLASQCSLGRKALILGSMVPHSDVLQNQFPCKGSSHSSSFLRATGPPMIAMAGNPKDGSETSLLVPFCHEAYWDSRSCVRIPRIGTGSGWHLREEAFIRRGKPASQMSTDWPERHCFTLMITVLHSYTYNLVSA